MQSVEGVSLAISCLKDGRCKRDLSLEQAKEAVLSRSGTVWLHLKVSDRAQAEKFLKDELGFHELAVEDALSPNERPALTEYEDHIFLVAPAIVQSNGEDNYVEVAFFLRQHALVTVAEADCPIIEQWVDRWTNRDMHASSTADILHILLDAIVDGYFPALDSIEDEVDIVADEIFQGEKGKVYDLLKTKRRLLEMRRRITPLRDVINGLLRRDIHLIPDQTRPYFQDVYDHSSRIAEGVDLQRDTLTSLLDVHLSVVSNNLNEVMKKMTVIATVLMTAALIAGVYGMNFDRIPELHWAFGYPFALGLMVVSSIGVLALFRWKKWI